MKVITVNEITEKVVAGNKIEAIEDSLNLLEQIFSCFGAAPFAELMSLQKTRKEELKNNIFTDNKVIKMHISNNQNAIKAVIPTLYTALIELKNYEK